MGLANRLITLSRTAPGFRCVHTGTVRNNYEGPQKTTVKILNVKDPTAPRLSIMRSTRNGFLLNTEQFIVGPIALFPKTVLHWNVNTASDVNDATLSLFTSLEPRLDILVIGVDGHCTKELSTQIRAVVLKHGIPVEILPVKQACEAYNFLLDDHRAAAAALIPSRLSPEVKRVEQEDLDIV